MRKYNPKIKKYSYFIQQIGSIVKNIGMYILPRFGQNLYFWGIKTLLEKSKI